MQPLDDEEREAIKQAHPDLDAEEVGRLIDQLEMLRAKRSFLDPETEEAELLELDKQRAELIEQKLPKFTQVLQKLHGQRREGA